MFTGEMNDYRTGPGIIQNKPGAFCNARSKKMLKLKTVWWNMWKRLKRQLKIWWPKLYFK